MIRNKYVLLMHRIFIYVCCNIRNYIIIVIFNIHNQADVVVEAVSAVCVVEVFSVEPHTRNGNFSLSAALYFG